VLDVADLVRDSVTIPCAFKAAAVTIRRPHEPVERLTRRMVGERLTRDAVIATLIDRIKSLLAELAADEDDRPLRKAPRPDGDRQCR
jgi:CRISPR-associated protein Cas1